MLVNGYFAVFVYWWTKCWRRPRPLLQTHKLTFLTNAHPFVCEKRGKKIKVSSATGTQSAL